MKKMLLTSSGLSKRVIGEALQAMAGRTPSECKVVFIPTAANVEPYNKDWIIAQFQQLQRYGFYQIDIVDFSAAGVDWRSRLEDADILWLTGGNTFHLLDQARKTGFDAWLRENIEQKIYVGGSASTLLVTPSIAIAAQADENLPGLTDLTGLGFVPFEINVHCDREGLRQTAEYAAGAKNPVYALDDLSAIQVIGEQVEVLSGGSWEYYPLATS